MPDAIITSTESTFGTISGTFAADQSTVTGTVSGIVAGTLSGSVGVPGPQGPTGATGATGPQGPQGEPGAPGVGVPVGGTAGQFLTKIDGTNYNTDWTTVNLSAYAVRANNLSDLTSASTARSNLGLGTMATATAADYSTTAVANGLYYPLSSNPAGYITSSALTGYATESWVASQGYLTDAPSDGSQYLRQNGAWTTVSVPPDFITSVSSPLSVTSGDLSIDLSAYETISSAAATYQTISGMSSYLTNSAAASTYFTIASAASKANIASPTFTGKVTTAASATGGAGFNIPHGTAPTSPVNGDIWTTTTGLFARVNSVTRQYVDLDGTQTINGTKTFSAASQTFGNSTAAGTINIGTGATVSGSTKALNIGTGGVAGSTTTITIGSNSGGTSTTTLQGTTNGVTAAADTNSTALATTAFVVGQAGSATPLVDGTAAVGTSLRYARQDHVHPTDTSRAALASPAFTGTPTAPTATAGTSTTQLATTAFVTTADNLKANLASPTFTGTPAAPTASPGTNTTQIATTAFVTAAVPAFATETQAIYGTSSTTAISPLLMRYIMSNAGYTAYTALLGNYSSYVSGSGSIPTVFSNFVQVAITAANGKAAFLPNNNVSYHSFSGRGVGELTINWTNPVWFSFRFNYSNTGQIGDANTINRVTIGKVSSTFGDLSSRGIGVKWTAGTSGAFTVMAHNGSALSTSASAVTVSNTTYFPTTNSAADFLVYSDGAGNVTLFCNNVQVATTTGGPSSGTSAGVRFTFETDNTTSTSGTVTCDYSGIRSMLTY